LHRGAANHGRSRLSGGQTRCGQNCGQNCPPHNLFPFEKVYNSTRESRLKYLSFLYYPVASV
jgi:hypothetical protein